MILYHGSKDKIDTFNDHRPIFFSAKESDTKLAIEHFYQENEDVKGYVYTIEIKDFELCSDFLEFHSGEIIKKSSKDVVKMESKDIDNYWFCVKNVNKYNPKLIN